MDRSLLYERINQRVDQMIKAGLLNEVKSVLKYKDQNALKTVGYRELFNYLEGKLTFEEAVEKIKVNSRRYAKRQLTWFKKDAEINWFNPSELTAIVTFIEEKSNAQ